MNVTAKRAERLGALAQKAMKIKEFMQAISPTQPKRGMRKSCNGGKAMLAIDVRQPMPITIAINSTPRSNRCEGTV